MTKVCKFCKEEKDLELFEKDKRAPDKHSCRCLDCAREIKRVSAAKHHDERLERQRKYREEHPEEYKAMKHDEYVKHRDRYRETGKKYYEENKEWFLNMCKEYRETHKEQKAATDKAYRERNKEYLQQYHKEYYAQNKEEHIQKCVARSKVRKTYDKSYHICVNTRERIRSAVKKDKGVKQHTLSLIGINIVLYRDYIESLFTEGMSWDNYGAWHIDHSRPCASFDLTDIIQQHFCFNYRNTQPMWGDENFQKSARWNDEDKQNWYSKVYPNIKADLIERDVIDSSYEGC